MSGTDVCRTIRAKSRVPIIMVTAKDSEIDKVLGLELGADDYITKPFSIREFRSRVRALLRRAATPHQAGKREERIERGDLTIDLPRRVVAVRGVAVQLTFVEFELLAALAAEPGVVFSRRQLLERIRGSADYREPRTIDVHVRHLREKIERDPHDPELILTVRGAGYRFRDG
jgi:DNA-binding response OmpR family regulator